MTLDADGPAPRVSELWRIDPQWSLPPVHRRAGSGARHGGPASIRLGVGQLLEGLADPLSVVRDAGRRATARRGQPMCATRAPDARDLHRPYPQSAGRRDSHGSGEQSEPLHVVQPHEGEMPPIRGVITNLFNPQPTQEDIMRLSEQQPDRRPPPRSSQSCIDREHDAACSYVYLRSEDFVARILGTGWVQESRRREVSIFDCSVDVGFMVRASFAVEDDNGSGSTLVPPMRPLYRTYRALVLVEVKVRPVSLGNMIRQIEFYRRRIQTEPGSSSFVVHVLACAFNLTPLERAQLKEHNIDFVLLPGPQEIDDWLSPRSPC